MNVLETGMEWKNTGERKYHGMRKGEKREVYMYNRK